MSRATALLFSSLDTITRPCLRPVLCLLLALALAACPAGAQDARRVPESRELIQLSFAPVVRQVAPALVNITSRRQPREADSPFAGDPLFRFFFRDFGALPSPQRRAQQSLGSGVIVRTDGLIVTNRHVIEGADEIDVVLNDRRSFAARVLSSDDRTDLAFLRLEDAPGRLPIVELGDSDRIEVGDLVLAIGNPFGIGQSVTSGIVSALARTAPQLERDVSFIQTDASINPGNSGGALVGMDGRLIGINTAIFTRSGGSVGIGFAIPANLVRARMQALDGGRPGATIQRPWLGAEAQTVDARLAQNLGLDRPQGVLLTRVHPAGAAARADLRRGDVVLEIDGSEVIDPASLNYRLALKPIGDRVGARYWRQGQLATVRIPLEPAPAEPPPDVTRLGGRHPLAGLTVANLSPGFNEEIGLNPFETGVVVFEVQPGSPASYLRLRPRDVLVAVNEREVQSVVELDRPFRGTQLASLTVRREGRTFVLSLRG